MKTQVAIIGGGPSGLLLSQLLDCQGIDTVILERKTKEYVLSRIRAGILETGLIELMHKAAASDRLIRECFIHDGTVITYGNEQFGVNFKELTGSHVVVYGQTEVTHDLYNAREKSGAKTIFNVENVVINDFETQTPNISFQVDGKSLQIDCEFIAGCDGFHGICRQTIPISVRKEFEKVYPFGWLGILSETPPVHEELIYTNSERGFSLCSMRSANLSRYYIQCSMSDNLDNWPDQRFWDELKRRLPDKFSDTVITGPSIEKSITPLRSFVTEPMRWGRLFLCGDAAHIVPPTGAKGLNTAASDVHYLYEALIQFFQENDSQGIDQYSKKALARVWKAERFSWWMTSLLHRFPDQSEFDRKIQMAELEFLRHNDAAQKALAQNYVGLPY